MNRFAMSVPTIEVDPESHYSTTFSMGQGVFQYKQIMQGENAGFEKYQHRRG